MVLDLLVQSLWFILPAYAANVFPPFMKGIRPLDFSRKLGSYRILGDGKTFEGTLAGIAFGVFVGSIQIQVYGYFQRLTNAELIQHTLPLVFLLSFGAIFGDIIGAFIKRRLGMPRGYPAPLLDQLDFLLFALLLSSAFASISTGMLVLLLVITPILHKLSNIVGYYVKLKRHPW